MGETAIKGGSPERFGYEWAEYHELSTSYEEQFRRWLPFYQPADWRGKTFLDTGCGMGRNSYWPLSYGAKAAKAIDVDERSLAAARRTLNSFFNAKEEKGSAYDIPDENAFNIVLSVGAVRHLKWPDKALAALTKAAKLCGDVAIWIYGQKNNDWLLWILCPARRLIFSRVPISRVHVLSTIPTEISWVALRLGLNRLSFFRLTLTFRSRHLKSNVFDQMLPRIANYWTIHKVCTLMEQARLKDIELAWVNEMSWAARGCKRS